MAAAASSAASGLTWRVTEIARCPICLDDFKDPRSLPCLHSFCLRCLQEYWKDSSAGDEVPCPVCREEFQIPDQGLGQLRHNFFVQSLIDARDASGSKTEVCESCAANDEDEQSKEKATIPQATEYCVDCSQKLCRSCGRAHRGMRDAHHVIKLGTEMKPEQLFKQRWSFCGEHRGKQVELYCFECQKSVCIRCFAVDHKQHNCQEIEKVGAQFAESIDAKVQSVSSRISEFKAAVEQVAQEDDEFLSTVDGIREKVGRNHEALNKLINSSVETLLKDLDSFQADGSKQAKDCADRLQLGLTAMESFCAYARELTARGSPCDIISAASEQIVRADELLKTYIIAGDFRAPGIRYASVEAAELEQSGHHLIGRLVTSVNSDADDSKAELHLWSDRESELKKAIEKLEQQVSDEKQRITELTETNVCLEADTTKSAEREQEMQEKLNQLQDEALALQKRAKDGATSEQQLATSKGLLADLETKVSQAAQCESDLRQQLQQAMASRDALQADFVKQKKDSAAELEAISNRERLMSKAVGELQGKLCSFERLQESERNTSDQLKQLQADVVELQKLLQIADATERQLQAELETQRKENAEMDKKVRLAEQSNNELQRQLSATETHQTDSKVEAEAAISREQDLRRKVEELEEQLHAREQELCQHKQRNVGLQHQLTQSAERERTLQSEVEQIQTASTDERLKRIEKELKEAMKNLEAKKAAEKAVESDMHAIKNLTNDVKQATVGLIKLKKESQAAVETEHKCKHQMIALSRRATELEANAETISLVRRIRADFEQELKMVSDYDNACRLTQNKGSGAASADTASKLRDERALAVNEFKKLEEESQAAIDRHDNESRDSFTKEKAQREIQLATGRDRKLQTQLQLITDRQNRWQVQLKTFSDTVTTLKRALQQSSQRETRALEILKVDSMQVQSQLAPLKQEVGNQLQAVESVHSALAKEIDSVVARRNQLLNLAIPEETLQHELALARDKPGYVRDGFQRVSEKNRVFQEKVRLALESETELHDSFLSACDETEQIRDKFRGELKVIEEAKEVCARRRAMQAELMKLPEKEKLMRKQLAEALSSEKRMVSDCNSALDGEKALAQQLQQLQDAESTLRTQLRHCTFAASVVKTLAASVAVCGLTSVNDKLYALHARHVDQLDVYNITDYSPLYTLDIPGLSISRDAANDMTSCAPKNCLYITDYTNKCIHRVDLSDSSVTQSDAQDHPLGISLARNGNLLVTCWGRDNSEKLVEFSSDAGLRVREIELLGGIGGPRHAAQLSSGLYVVCHIGHDSDLHRVCVVGDDGVIARVYGNRRGSGALQLNMPRHVAVDRNSELVFVADNFNNRVVLISSSTLDFIGHVIEDVPGRGGPCRLYLDHRTDRLYVGQQGGGITVLQLHA